MTLILSLLLALQSGVFSAETLRPFPVRVTWFANSPFIVVEYQARAIEVAVVNPDRDQVLVVSNGVRSGMRIDVTDVLGGPLEVWVLSDEKLSAVVTGILPFQ